MSTEENKQLLREFFKEVNAEKNESVETLVSWYKYYSPDYVMHSTTGDLNLEQYKKYIQGMTSAFPDYEFTLSELIAEYKMYPVIICETPLLDYDAMEMRDTLKLTLNQ